MPINQRFSAGLSIVPAWGFTEDYGEGSILRYNLTRVYTKSLDISPSLAMRITNQWSFGMGPDFHYFSAESKTHVRTQGTIAPIAGTTGDSISRFSADRWGYGLHAGVLYNYDDHTRVGVGYRSRMTQDLTGSSDFGLDTTGPLFETRAFKLALPLPSVTTFSIYHDFNPCWAVMGTVAYDQWSALRDYHARNYIQPPVPGNPSGILPNVTLPQDMSNTFDFGIGTHYRWNDNLMLRANFKYLPTPTKTVNRAVDFPDGVKYGIQIGARYQFSKKMALDLIYGHVFVKTMGIHDVNPVTNAVATGTAKTSIDLFGGQLVYNI
jgi:long-chain fatty acid transport protein